MKHFSQFGRASVIVAIAVVLHIFGLNFFPLGDAFAAYLKLGDPYITAATLSFFLTLVSIALLIWVRKAYRDSLSTTGSSRFIKLTSAGLRSADNRLAKRISFGILATFVTLGFSSSVTWLSHSINHLIQPAPSLPLFAALAVIAIVLFGLFFSATRLPFSVRDIAVDASSDVLVIFLSVPPKNVPIETLKPASPDQKPWNHPALSPHNWLMPILSIHHQAASSNISSDPSLRAVLVISSEQSAGHFENFEMLVNSWFPYPNFELVQITKPGIDFLNVEKIHEAIESCDRWRSDHKLHHLLIDLTGGMVPCSVVAAIWALEPGAVFKYIYRKNAVGEQGIHRAFDIAYEPARELGEAD